MVVIYSVAWASRSLAVQTALKRVGHKCLAELHLSRDVAACTIDLPTVTVPMAKFVKNEVVKPSLKKDKMDHYRNLSNKAIVLPRKNAENELPPRSLAK